MQGILYPHPQATLQPVGLSLKLLISHTLIIMEGRFSLDLMDTSILVWEMVAVLTTHWAQAKMLTPAAARIVVSTPFSFTITIQFVFMHIPNF